MTDTATPMPRPSRRRKLRIVLCLFVLLIVALVLGHYSWSRHGANAIQAQADAYRLLGQTVTLEDFQDKPIPDDQNAAIDLRAAAAAITLADEQKEFRDDFEQPYLPLTDQQLAILRAIVQSNSNALRLARAARGKPGLAWNLKLQSPVINSNLTDLAPQCNLADLLVMAAISSHLSADDQAALEAIEDLLFVGCALQKQPAMMAYLVGGGITDRATETIVEIAHDLRTGSAPAPAVAADRQRVGALIRRLLDEDAARQSFIFAMYSERMMLLDATRCLAAGQTNIAMMFPSPSAQGPSATALAVTYTVLRPLLLRDGIRVLRVPTQIADAVAAPTWPAAKSLIPDAANSQRFSTPHIGVGMLLASLDRVLERHYRLAADRRAAATVLAIRLYAIDHGNKLPPKLADLVPQYLPAVPQDPLAPDGSPFRYLPRDKDPILYSVGDNGVDDQGGSASSSKHVSNSRWTQLDATYSLIPQPKPHEDPAEQNLLPESRPSPP